MRDRDIFKRYMVEAGLFIDNKVGEIFIKEMGSFIRGQNLLRVYRKHIFKQEFASIHWKRGPSSRTAYYHVDTCQMKIWGLFPEVGASVW